MLVLKNLWSQKIDWAGCFDCIQKLRLQVWLTVDIRKVKMDMVSGWIDGWMKPDNTAYPALLWHELSFGEAIIAENIC